MAFEVLGGQAPADRRQGGWNIVFDPAADIVIRRFARPGSTVEGRGVSGAETWCGTWQEHVLALVKEALDTSGIKPSELDCICFTKVLCGSSFTPEPLWLGLRFRFVSSCVPVTE